MVEGLDRFKSHFSGRADQYVLIGGAACAIAMDNVGRAFRATKDLDIVLCVEVLSTAFVAAFWQFVRDGGYRSHETASGQRQFHRFQKPAAEDYPVMLELFSRTPDLLKPAVGGGLTPIPMDDEISSLSAILMDDDYYGFLQAGKRVIEGVQIAGAELLIPLKARAWLDLTELKRTGGRVDSSDLKKHKNDVFRLSAIVDPESVGMVPEQIRKDLRAFLDQVPAEGVNLKALGLGRPDTRKRQQRVENNLWTRLMWHRIDSPLRPPQS